MSKKNQVLEDDKKNVHPLMQVLPENVKRRVMALKKLQLQTLNIEAKFFVDVHKLECQYNSLLQELYTKRENIVTGTVEPTEEDCFISKEEKELDELKENELAKYFKEKANLDEKLIGIPDFWLTIFQNVELLNDMIQPHDVPILKHLIDVKLIFVEEPMGFVLEFHFSTNTYFSNTVLTKEYEMKCFPDENDPWSFEGPEIYKCKGCIIDWYKGMNVTVKTLRKRQRHKSRGAVRTIVKTVQNDSFFNFFSPPIVPEDQEGELDEDTQTLLTSDFEIGHYIRDRIIPHAVLYYTGEALEDEEVDDDEVTESSESDEEFKENDEELTTEEDDEDEDFVPSDNKSKPSKNKNEKPPECSQQ